MYEDISVPIEGTGDSGAAVALAIDLARQHGGTIELIAVHQLPSQKAEVEAARTRVESTGLAATVTVLEGKVAEALTDYVAASGADLVVMTPRAGRLERLLLGSVTSEVVRHGGKPVLILPPGIRTAESSLNIRRILVGLDGSPFADQIIPHAQRLAQRVQGQIILLTVLEPMMAAVAKAGVGEPMLGLGAPLDTLTSDEESVSRALTQLDQRAAPLRATGLDVVTDVVLGANVGRTIVDYVSRKAIDLVAMSTNGRGGLKRLVMGSVAREIIDASNAMLLVIRPVSPVIADLPSPQAADWRDRVDEVGRESFPASDPPSWSTLISRAPRKK